MHKPGSSGAVWRERESVPAGCMGEWSEGWEHVRNEECVSDGGCQEAGELWLWNRRPRHAAEGKKEKWKTEAQIVTHLTLTLFFFSFCVRDARQHASGGSHRSQTHRQRMGRRVEAPWPCKKSNNIFYYYLKCVCLCVCERERKREKERERERERIRHKCACWYVSVFACCCFLQSSTKQQWDYIELNCRFKL